MKRKRIDITGYKYHRLTVMKEVEARGRNRRHLCRCDCGKEIVAFMSALRSGNTKSCGCKKVRLDLTGHKYGYLTVVKEVDRRDNRRMWLCKCICGKEKIIRMGSLRDGNTKSCGCCQKTKLTQEECLNDMLEVYEKHGIVTNKTLESMLDYTTGMIRKRFENVHMKEIWKKVIIEYSNKKSDRPN